MATLKILNFGAIKHAELEIKKYNIFIGETSSGKSTVAKLLTIFNSSVFWALDNGAFTAFQQLLEKYNINFVFDTNTEIEYINGEHHWHIQKNSFETTYKDTDLLSLAQSQKTDEFISKFIEKKFNDPNLSQLAKSVQDLYTSWAKLGSDVSSANIRSKILVDMLSSFIYDKNTPIYIPAERLLISMFSNNIFSLLSAGTNIPECIIDFGRLYEKARKQEKNINLEVLNMQISFSDDGDTVYLKDEDREIKFKQTSSGVQSLIPLWTVFKQFVESDDKQILVIEEPELNLFPSTQAQLIKQIIYKMRKSKGSIVLTTHSPYILSSIDNFILANEVLKNSEKKSRREVIKDIKNISPNIAYIDFEEISSYYFPRDGEVVDILDRDIKSVGAENIDEASNESSQVFNELYNLLLKKR